MTTSFSGGRSRREPPTMGKQLVSFIICDCESDQGIIDKDDLEYLKPDMLKLVILSSYIKSTKKTT
jgi:hypothetical protein